MFKYNISNDVKYMTVTEIENLQIVNHAFSTRIGGVSTGEAATMNFGLNRKDTLENIKQNFKLLCHAIGSDYKNIVLSNQVHGNRVYAVSEKDAGKGLFISSDILGVDALVTNVPDVPICTFHADCMPIFFVDKEKRAIGLAHSGWKSTALNIAKETIDKMIENYGCNPKDIICAIGPSIGPCHFEVDLEVAEKFPNKFVIEEDKPHINLWEVCEEQLINCGVLKQNLIKANICTYCEKDTFYSYRGDNHKTGSMVSIMQLRRTN